MNIFQIIFIACVRLYQKILSPNHNTIGLRRAFTGCRYYPSCSEYAIQAVRQYGLLKGSVVSANRIMRCHPFAKGGYDPVSK